MMEMANFFELYHYQPNQEVSRNGEKGELSMTTKKGTKDIQITEKKFQGNDEKPLERKQSQETKLASKYRVIITKRRGFLKKSRKFIQFQKRGNGRKYLQIRSRRSSSSLNIVPSSICECPLKNILIIKLKYKSLTFLKQQLKIDPKQLNQLEFALQIQQRILINFHFYFSPTCFLSYYIIIIRQMAKDKLKLGESRDSNLKTRPRSQKCKNKGSEEKISPFGRRKSLSLSFYNQQTLEGSKKIMLDLLPIEGVQTQYTSSRNHRIQLQKFAQLQTKSTIEKNKRSKPEKKQLNQSSGNSKSREKRKNSLHVLPSQRKALFNEPRTSGSNQKPKPAPFKSENTRNPSRREAYLQKYLNGYLKKAKLCK